MFVLSPKDRNEVKQFSSVVWAKLDRTNIKN
jgi:hypothetical protein